MFFCVCKSWKKSLYLMDLNTPAGKRGSASLLLLRSLNGASAMEGMVNEREGLPVARYFVYSEVPRRAREEGMPDPLRANCVILNEGAVGEE